MTDPSIAVENILNSLNQRQNGYIGDPFGAVRRSIEPRMISYNVWKAEPLSKHKSKPLTYQLTSYNTLTKYVLKVNPAENITSWNNVKHLYHILDDFNRRTNIPVPKVKHFSSPSEADHVGSDFLILQYVEGHHFGTIQELYTKFPLTVAYALKSVMREMANVHRYHWIWLDTNRKCADLQTDSFWSNQCQTWRSNYGDGYGGQQQATSFLSSLVNGTKPSNNNTQIIHGDLDISNIIFDVNFNVAAILDWKFSGVNGDPLVDVAYFTMMFTHLPDENLRRLPLLTSSCDNFPVTEESLLREYHEALKQTAFYRKDLKYAKAVACARLISVLQAAKSQGFVGHECGQYRQITVNSDRLITTLTDYGKGQYQDWTMHGHRW